MGQRAPHGPSYRDRFDKSLVAETVCDRRGVLIDVNPAFGRLLDEPAERLTARPVSAFNHRSDPGTADAALAQVLAGEVEATQVERVLRRADGRPVPTLASATLLRDEDGAPAGAAALYQDLSVLHGVEHRRRQQEDFFIALAQRASDLAVVLDPDGRVLYASPAVVGMLGHAVEDILSEPAIDLVHPDDAPFVDALFARVIGEGGNGTGELRVRDADGGWHWMELTAGNLLDTAVGGVICNLRDITDRIRAEEALQAAERRLESELRQAALHDTLTGLPNRALLLDRLEQALIREPTGVALLYVDLDHFRLVNDARGHAIGDQLLVDVATRLRAAVRPADTVARFGGDQFLVVCEDVDEGAARAVAGAARAALRPPFAVAGGDVDLAASIGIALGPATSGPTLLRHAETAMLAAKTRERGPVRLFDPEIAEVTQQGIGLGVDLARALTADELSLHYQPVVDLRTGQVVGVEALARWDHPVLGPVPPTRFVAAAERAGLAPTLDRWVLARATREAAGLSVAGLPPRAYLAVNLSARTLADPDLEDWVTDAVCAAGLRPEDVVLEVTESAVMSDAATAVALLGRLRQRGHRIAVDDFGTGHSSLSYLRRLPVSVLKVDRSFVAEITTDAGTFAITRSIVDLARSVGLSVVAEGVESPEQAVALRRLGADSGQGWLWSPAVSPAEAARSGALGRTYDVGAVLSS